jgi:hypothetical protein
MLEAELKHKNVETALSGIPSTSGVLAGLAIEEVTSDLGDFIRDQKHRADA